MKTIVCFALSCLMFHVVLAQDPGPPKPQGGVFKCFQCNNYDNKVGCGHGKDADSQFIKECVGTRNATYGPQEKGVNTVEMYLPPGKTFNLCRKIVTVVDFDVNTNKATERIKRTCGYLESEYDDKCYYRAGLGGRQTVCTCTETECNHGNLDTPINLGLCLALSLFALVVKTLNYS